MWILRDESKQLGGIAGVPWRDMTDDEFEAVCAEYDLQFPDQPRSLERHFDYVEEV